VFLFDVGCLLVAFDYAALDGDGLSGVLVVSGYHADSDSGVLAFFD